MSLRDNYKLLHCKRCDCVPIINNVYSDEGILRVSYTCDCGRRRNALDTILEYFSIQHKEDVKIKQSIYCAKHQEEKKRKFYCVDCGVLMCSVCDKSHSEHKLNDIIFNEESLLQLKDDFAFANNSITLKINKEKESLLSQIDETITQLTKDRNRIIQCYERNQRNNNLLIQLVTLLFNNYEHSKENYYNYLNLFNWSKFNLSQKKTDTNDDNDVNSEHGDTLSIDDNSSESNESDIYHNVSTIQAFEYNRRLRETNTKSLHQKIEQFIKECCHCLILTNIQNSLLSNLSIDYIKALKPSHGFCLLSESLIYYKDLNRSTIISFELPNNKLGIVFSRPPCIRIYDTNNYRFIKNITYGFLNSMTDMKIMKLEGNEFLVYTISAQDKFNWEKEHEYDAYYKDIKVDNNTIVQMLHTNKGYFILTYNNLCYMKYYDQTEYITLLEFDKEEVIMVSNDLTECCHGHIIIEMNLYFLIVEVNDINAKILHTQRVESSIKRMTSMDNSRLAFWIKDYIMIFNCELFQTETYIKFMKDTGMNNNFCYADGALLVTETNSLYIIDTEKYICDRKYLFNKYYTIGAVLPLTNRRIAIVLNQEIYFLKY